MYKIEVKTTKKSEVVDISDLVNKKLQEKSLISGVCNLFVTHTTAALTCADLDPGTELDLLDAYYEMVPKLKYRHPHNPSHVGDHILSSLIGVSLTIPVASARLVLGTWQKVVLLEFDGPRERIIIFNFLKQL